MGWRSGVQSEDGGGGIGSDLRAGVGAGAAVAGVCCWKLESVDDRCPVLASILAGVSRLDVEVSTPDQDGEPLQRALQ